MNIMTRVGPVTRDTLHQALAEDIREADPGIEIVPIKMPWGSVVSLYRQGQSTRWKVWFYADGTSAITHPKTATLPQLSLSFDREGQILVRDYLHQFINQGWI
jgi:hypothetical protein